MRKSIKKLYSKKRPSHPELSHSPKYKKFFKRKGVKRVRKELKEEIDSS